MKRFFTLIAFAAVMTPFANALNIQINGEKVENGATVTFTRDDFKQALPIPDFPWKAECSLVVESVGGATAKVVTDTEAFQFCPLGTCLVLSPQDGVFTATTTFKDSPMDIHISLADNSPQVGSFKYYADLTFTEGLGKPFTVKLVYDTTGAGVEDAATDKITFTGSAFNYSYETPAKLQVYSLTGATVLEKTLQNTGTLPLSSLKSGVYVYKVGNKVGRIRVH